MNLLDQLKNNPFILAPMAGITDVAFRSFMKSMGCSIVVTELVSATGLKYNSQKTKNLMSFEKMQHPVGVQIFGDNLENLEFAAKVVEDSGADFIDLNFGCPVPKVVKKGGGSAILKDLGQVKEVFKTVKSATDLPVTVKVRTGWDEASKNTSELCNIAFNEGLTWVAIHGRTRAQGYKGQANWEYIKQVKASSKIPVIGNGDICTAEQAVSRLSESGCDAVMIGRGCLKNPWIFKEALALLSSATLEASEDRDTFEHVFEKLNLNYQNHVSEKIRILQLKKLSSWYSAGLPESSAFRKEIFSSNTVEETLGKISNYFSQYDSNKIKSINNDGFLMGGHG